MTLPNPLEMFDVRGKVALITGASGAFGMVAARVLAGAGCKLVLAAGNANALDEIATECREAGAEVLAVNTRPDSEAACLALVQKAVASFGVLDILVVASGMNKVAKIEDMSLETFASVMDANVNQSWLLGARRHCADEGTGRERAYGRQDRSGFLCARAVGPSGGLYRLLCLQSGG